MRKVIITGTQMTNKGSQAMLFSAINGIKRHHPESEVVCFCIKYKDVREYESQTDFTILPWDFKMAFLFWTGLYKLCRRGLLKKFAYLEEYIDKVSDALKDCDAIFDASGYVLGQGWPPLTASTLLINCSLAKRYKKKIYILPQSFGPFVWDKYTGILKRWSQKVLSYAEVVYAREEEGVKCLRQLGIKNAVVSMDLVIRDVDYEKCIHLNNRQTNKYDSFIGYVGVIINENIFKRYSSEAEVYEAYINCIVHLHNRGERILLIKTSDRDNEFINKLFDCCRQKNIVVAIMSDKLDSYSTIELLAKMKILIASRYHSLVFGFRNGIPALAIGWSVKYEELFNAFGMKEFCLDFSEYEEDKVNSKIDKLLDCNLKYRQQIDERLKKIREKDLFDEFEF